MTRPRLFARLYVRTGRRGLVLLLFATIFVLSGLFTATGPYAPVEGLVHTYPPPYVLGAVYVAAGGVAVWAALRAGVRATTPGFVALAIPLLLEASSSVLGSVLWVLTGGQQGMSTGWLAGVQAGFYMSIMLVVASWPEEAPPVDLDGEAPPSLTGEGAA